MDLSRFDVTIIIVNELHEAERGYKLKGREFVVKEPMPVKRAAKTLDGRIVEDDYYVVSAEEYLRVVPEAKSISSSEVLIPVFVARPSFRPKYLKKC